MKVLIWKAMRNTLKSKFSISASDLH